MLETEEVDIDYFTPAESTSLASIFGKSSVSGDTKENTTLKYVPPPPPEKSKLDETKTKQLIFTCAIHGFEWINSEYVNRGKLGLVILKMATAHSPSIILYDSNKTTVSCVTVSPKLSIHIRDVSTISYYDNAQKYWSIKTSDEDLNKISQLLKDFQATIVPMSIEETDKQPGNSNIDKNDDVKKDDEHKEEHDTDTDFYQTQKTKDSILKRMANMGHSVLPPHDKSKECPSDSSDSYDNDHKKNIKHKPRIPLKNFTDLSTELSETNIGSQSTKSTHSSHMEGKLSGQSQSTTTEPILYDTNMFISEQKISNSELRINVNRVSDKLDLVLTKLNDVIHIEKSNSVSNFQNDIVQKLIREYENKINHYEYLMNSKGIDYNTMQIPDKNDLNERVSNTDSGEEMKKIDELQNVCKEKDDIIKGLEEEIRTCNEKSIKTSIDEKKKIEGLLMEIKSLTENLQLKNEEKDMVKKNLNSRSNQDSSDIANKVKKIMNDTFEAISVNFENTEVYSGERIKAIVAKVIKKTTIKALEEL